MLNWLRNWLSADQQDLDELWERLEELEKRYELDMADLNDRVYPLLKKLNQRTAVRESREKEPEPLYKPNGGIIGYGPVQK